MTKKWVRVLCLCLAGLLVLGTVVSAVLSLG